MSERLLFLLQNSLRVLPEVQPTPPVIPPYLREQVNTDNIIRAEDCVHFADLAPFALAGLEGIKEGEIAVLSPSVLIAGESFGGGSAREHAPLSLQEAGIKLIIAPSFNATFQDNCLNLGILTSTNLDLVERLIEGETVPEEEILTEFEGLEKDILTYGGLFGYTQARLQKAVQSPEITTPSRPMTMVEKIIAQHLSSTQETGKKKVFVKPGDQAFVPVDLRMSYEVFTPLMARLFDQYFAADAVQDPQSVFLVADHFIANVVQENHPVHRLLAAQNQFGQQQGVNIFENDQQCAQGICHNLMIEEQLLPGQLGTGTDSHTGMWGVLGALGWPVGTTAMTNALLTKDIKIKVPESVKITINGELNPACSARDVMSYLATTISPEQLKDTVIEFEVENLSWSVDELAVLTCLAKELGALSAVIKPNEQVVQYLVENRSLNREQIGKMITSSDPEAEYANQFDINLAKIQPMVIPPKNQKPINIAQIENQVAIQRAYIGGCVGGKWEDLTRTTAVLKDEQITKGVNLAIQPATRKIWQRAIDEGLADVFAAAGAEFLCPNCGACIGQGKGAVQKGETAIFNTTRNYGGRMKEAEVWLASAETVAASAIQGYISAA